MNRNINQSYEIPLREILPVAQAQHFDTKAKKLCRNK